MESVVAVTLVWLKLENVEDERTLRWRGQLQSQAGVVSREQARFRERSAASGRVALADGHQRSVRKASAAEP
jgi:hypothetical protein